MKRLLFIFTVLFASQSLFAEFTIHVMNPWKNDTSANRRDSLRMVGNAEVNYFPGSNMIPEGNDWFYYTYKKDSINTFSSFKLTTWVGPATYMGSVTYGRSMRIDSLFKKVPTGTDEIWVEVNSDTTKFPTVYAFPPKGKVINIFNPWPENSSKIVVNKNPPLQMRVNEDYCGWYRTYYAGSLDSLTNVTFTDYFEKEKYTSSGLTGNGGGINLKTILQKADTIFILPTPFPAGAPVLRSTFPGRVGDCNTRKVSGIFRDWKLDDYSSFFNQPMGKTSGGRNMVFKTLTAPDYLPTFNPASAYSGPTQIDSWFRTVTLSDGKKNDTCIDLEMTKSYNGKWTYNSDLYGGFFPLDNFNDLNNIKYSDSLNANAVGATMHNYHFTMEMHLQFLYTEGQGLEFAFKGDDDVWIFVNNQLAIDLGGLNYYAVDTLRLDKKKDALGLVSGQIYSMDIFYAERNPIGSNLLIQTTMDLKNSSELYYKDTLLSNGVTQYDIWEQIKSQGVDCGLTRITSGEKLSNVNFFIEGPSFTSVTSLPPGEHYKGINVDGSKSRVTIDSAKIDGLLPGDYRITFISTEDTSRSGYLTFTVVPKPDHLDLLPDTMALDLKKDAVVDSVYMAAEQDSVTLYSVIRDVIGDYIKDADNLTWTSRDINVVTVSPQNGDISRAKVSKVGGGSTWIVVNQNGLKPDSVLIHAEARPNWPLYSSAVMKDNHGDLIPDIVEITLSDTFKTDQSLKSVLISYKNKQYTISGTDCQISGTKLTVPFTTLSGIDGRPFGTVTLVEDVKGKEQTSAGSFTDGVGAALTAAEVLEKESGEQDILYLTFSEPITMTKLSGQQLLLIRNNVNDTIALNISAIKSKINDTTYAVIITSSSAVPTPGDKLRLVPGSKGGAISDTANNLPHDQNKPVVVTLKKGAVSIQNAWYKDVNADGVLDSLLIHFKRSIDLSELDTVTVEWNQKSTKLSPDKISKVSDSVVAISINGTIVSTSQIATEGAMYINQTYKSVPGLHRDTTVADSAAPVLLSATLTLGGYDDKDVKCPDTLQVKFSEPVKISGTHPFQLWSLSSSCSYQFETSSLSGNGSLLNLLVKKNDPENISSATGDSIWINASDNVTDQNGAAQLNKANHRVILNVKQPQTTWIVKIFPNPNKLPGTPVNIRLISKKNIDLKSYHSSIKIYDGFGNLLADEPMVLESKYFTYKWDGYNKNGRAVGAGTYIGYINIFDSNNGVIFKENRKIGIKR